MLITDGTELYDTRLMFNSIQNNTQQYQSRPNMFVFTETNRKDDLNMDEL